MYYRHKDVPKVLGNKKPPPKEKKPKGLKSKTKPLTLVEQLDRVFSQFVRKSSADLTGICQCYTCTTKKHWKQMQCGHFMSRKHKNTRWDTDNVRVQCNICNENLNGNLVVYSENLVKECGKDILLELAVCASQSVKFSKPELEEMIYKYKELLKSIV